MTLLASSFNSLIDSRRLAEGDDPLILSEIYEEDCNIAVWKRGLTQDMKMGVESLLESNTGLQALMTLGPDNAAAIIHKELGATEITWALSHNIAELVDIFCCLFELERVALRMTVLDKAMCPRFHVDHVPARLVTTYHGVATQWLPHIDVDRSKLGHGSEGKADSESGLIKDTQSIQQLNCGDVALLKGERWDGNEGAGLVHRSPAIEPQHPRLLLTIDFSQ